MRRHTGICYVVAVPYLVTTYFYSIIVFIKGLCQTWKVIYGRHSETIRIILNKYNPIQKEIFMKIIVTKCLVLGVLAIGMSSTVMANEKAALPHHTGNAIAFELMPDAAPSLHGVYLLLDGHGHITGQSCHAERAQDQAPSICSPISGEATISGNEIKFELEGNSFLKENNLQQVRLLLTMNTETGIVHYAQSMDTQDLIDARKSEYIAGPASLVEVKFRNSQFAVKGTDSDYTVQAPSQLPLTANVVLKQIGPVLKPPPIP